LLIGNVLQHACEQRQIFPANNTGISIVQLNRIKPSNQSRVLQRRIHQPKQKEPTNQFETHFFRKRRCSIQDERANRTNNVSDSCVCVCVCVFFFGNYCNKSMSYGQSVAQNETKCRCTDAARAPDFDQEESSNTALPSQSREAPNSETPPLFALQSLSPPEWQQSCLSKTLSQMRLSQRPRAQ
jgi:hypothetical protein